MATQNVCRYFKFGFCKYLEKCHYQHVKEECENHDCDVKSCFLRHPKVCNYYKDYNRCKFGEWCYFKHVEKSKNSDTEILNKIENLEKIIEAKDSAISILMNKIKRIEEKLFKDEKVVTENNDEKELRKEISDKFKCDLCEFESNSKRGVHIHMKKKHGQKFECDLCEKVFDSVAEGKIHRKTHSFKSRYVFLEGEEQTCDNCDFSCKCIYTMEVHIGKCFSDNLECGLCDTKFDDKDNLELHLRTCEVYECSECYLKDRNLNDMKKHVLEDHEEFTDTIQHMKIDLENLTKVIIKSYKLSEL